MIAQVAADRDMTKLAAQLLPLLAARLSVTNLGAIRVTDVDTGDIYTLQITTASGQPVLQFVKIGVGSSNS